MTTSTSEVGVDKIYRIFWKEVINIEQLALFGEDKEIYAGINSKNYASYPSYRELDDLLPSLLDNGVVYVGSSAGSIVCCPTIEGAIKFDDPKDAPDLVSYEGLNLFDQIIIPHAQKEKYAERIRETIEEMTKKGFEVETLTDNEAVLINDDEVKKVTISQE